MKIKHILNIMLMVFSVVPLCLFGGFMIYENNQRIDAVISENLEVTSQLQILDIKKSCEDRKSRMEMVGDFAMVKDAVRASLEDHYDDREYRYLEDLLDEQKSHYPYTASISLIDRNFKVVSSSEQHAPDELSDLKEIKQEYLDGAFHILSVYERETEDGLKRVVDAIQGIWDDTELIGYVVQEIETSYFDRNRTESKLWESGTLYVLDGKGNLVTAGTSDEDSRTELVSTIEERESYVEAWNEVDHVANPSGEIRYTFGGDEYITYYSNIDSTDWSIRVTINASEYKEVTRPFQVMLAILFLSLVGILTVLSYVLAKKLTGPIERIADTLKQIQDDENYTLRVDMRWRDELGYLADKINLLLDYIEQENLQEKEHQRFLERKAERDPLTGIMNKKAVEEKVQDLIQQAVEQKQQVVVGFLDVDNFKQYNTDYGHLRGDHVLQFVASVLQESVEDGLVGRVGGDEFLFSISGTDLEGAAKQLAERIMEKLRQGFLDRENNGHTSVPCSLGITVASGERMNYSSVVNKADEAMYHAKANGKNGYHIV